MIGRELQDLLTWLLGNRAQLVLTGAAGSGRSRALRQMVDDVRESGFPVAFVRPSVDDGRDLASATLALGLGTGLVQRAEHLADALVQAWRADPGTDGVVCIDDADLFDTETLRAVCVASRRSGMRVVLTTISPERLVRGLPEARFHQLRPWDGDQIQEVVRGTAERGPVPEVLERLTALAGGNPGAAQALTASLSPAQLLGFEPMLPVTYSVPLTVRLTSRISPRLWSAALLMACAGASAPAVLERAGQWMGARVEDFDALEQAGLAENVRDGLGLRPSGLGFAVEAVSAGGERRRAHTALANAFAGVDEIRALWHRAQAAGEPDADLAGHLERTCELASRGDGWSTASHLMKRASELSTSTGERGRRLVLAAEYAWLEGAPARSLRLLTEAEELSADLELRLRVAYVRGSVELAAGAEDRALRVMLDAVPDALHHLPQHEGTALLMRACDAAVAAGDVTAAVGLGRRAQERLATGSDSASGVRLRLVAGTAKILAEDLEGGLALVEDVLTACAPETDQPHALVGMRAALISADAAALARYGDLAVDRLRESNNRGLIPFATARRALADVLLGRLRSAVDLTVSGLEEAALLGQENARAEHLGVQALAHARAGDTEQAVRSAELGLRVVCDHGLAWPGALAVWALGEVELAAGRSDQALERLTLLWHGSRHERHPLVATLAAAETVEAAARSGRRQEGDVALGRLVAWARATGNAAGAGLVERCTALRSDDPGKVEESYQRALFLHREAQLPFEEARTSLAYGAWLRRERRKSESRAPLRTAYERFESIGASVWQANAAQEVRASGDTALQREMSGTGTHLTAQELTIARLVADGDSNRQVAGKLSISVRTVEYHLRNVFLKLGIRTRTELAVQRHLLAGP